MSETRVLVTGASGFVCEALVFRLLLDKKIMPIAALRKSSRLQGLCPTVFLDLNQVNTFPALNNVNVVVHAAARVHVMNETAADALEEFRNVNVNGTLKLAQHAAASGVKRFIFVSSIKVNGERTYRGKPFLANDPPAPVDPYAISKHEAEEQLKLLGQECVMEIVIVRPPLVYGPGVKANFQSMLSWLHRNIPLPLGAIDNRRSLVSIGNLVDFLVMCIDHPRASNNTFLVSDGEDMSTSQLLRRLGNGINKPARLLSIPFWLLRFMAILVGKKALAGRLGDSLQVDIHKNQELLGWIPPVSVDKSLLQTARHFLEKRR